MRVTVSLDDDVAAVVEHLRLERQIPVSQAVNELIRAGLRPREQRAVFRQRTQRLGLMVDVTNVGQAFELLDDTAPP